MRTKDILKEIEDVAIFYQYLYLSPNHNIIVNNGLTDLKYELSENLHILQTNMNFPEYGASNRPLDLTNILGIVDILKKTPAIEYPKYFDNRWTEIKTITQSNVARNL